MSNVYFEAPKKQVPVSKDFVTDGEIDIAKEMLNTNKTPTHVGIMMTLAQITGFAEAFSVIEEQLDMALSLIFELSGDPEFAEWLVAQYMSKCSDKCKRNFIKKLCAAALSIPKDTEFHEIWYKPE